MIAANDVGRKDSPVFGSDTNALQVFWPEKDGHMSIPSGKKTEIAKALLELLAKRLRETK